MSTVTTDDRRAEPTDPTDPPAGPFADLIARARRILECGPKDDDYLAIPDQSREDVDRHIAGHRANGIEVEPATRLRMLIDQALFDLYKGSDILAHRTDRGVVVVAAGSDEVSAVIRAVPLGGPVRVVLEYP